MRRRDFLSLCGLAAGSCLVPDAIARVIRDTCVLSDRPYLILPRNPSDTLYAYSGDGKTDFMLHIGDPTEATPAPTWKEYFEEFECIDINDKDEVRDWWLQYVGDPEDEPITIDPKAEIDGAAFEQWEWRQETHEGPSARAFHLLRDLPLDDERRLKNGDPLASWTSSKATAPDRTSPMWRLRIWRLSLAYKIVSTNSAKTSLSKSANGERRETR